MLDKPKIPRELLSLWNAYTDIIAGVDRLSFGEIDSYMRVMRTTFTPWQISVMMKLESTRNG